MNGTHGIPFDNVALRLREGRCLVLTVRHPFVVGYWPDLQGLSSQLGLAKVTDATLGQAETRERFLNALADKVRDDRLRPARIGFLLGSDEVRQLEEFRRNC